MVIRDVEDISESELQRMIKNSVKRGHIDSKLSDAEKRAIILKELAEFKQATKGYEKLLEAIGKL